MQPITETHRCPRPAVVTMRMGVLVAYPVVCLCLALTCSAAHGVHASEVLHNHRINNAAVSSVRAEDSAEMMTVVRPFVVAGATVRGPVSDELQSQLEGPQRPDGAAVGGRGLLHGTKKPKKYPKCNSCRMVQCRGSYCSGHCRRNMKLFFCDTRAVPAFACAHGTDYGDEPTVEDFEGQPPGSIAVYDTVVVTAEAPYIGCADIANRPSGCPARGTAALLPGRRRATVVGSVCRSEYYVPDCLSPLLPVGVCECLYRDARAPSRPRGRLTTSRFIRAPCRTTELPAGSGVGGADGSPSDEGVVVQPSGDVTLTWFSNFTDPGQEPQYSYNVTATVRSIDVDVTLSIYPALVLFSDYLQEGSDFPENYAADYEPDPERAVGDYDPDRIDRGYLYENPDNDPPVAIEAAEAQA